MKNSEITDLSNKQSSKASKPFFRSGIGNIVEGLIGSEEKKGRIVSKLVPGNFLLGSKLGDWYEKNAYHKFDKGDILVLKARRIFGYGIRPVVVVGGYEIKVEGSRTAGYYNTTAHSDVSGDFFVWMNENRVPDGTGRVAANEVHSKWNIENQFIKVDVKTVEEALELYRSRVY